MPAKKPTAVAKPAAKKPAPKKAASPPREKAPGGTLGSQPPLIPPTAIRVTDKNGNTVTHPTFEEAAMAIGQAMTDKFRPKPAAIHFGAQARDAMLGTGAQRDIEDPDQAGVHPKQREVETEVGGIAADRLRSTIERVERLEEEKKALNSDIKDIFAEAKSAGFDVRVIRAILVIRKAEPADVEEQEALLDLYRRALGM